MTLKNIAQIFFISTAMAGPLPFEEKGQGFHRSGVIYGQEDGRREVEDVESQRWRLFARSTAVQVEGKKFLRKTSDGHFFLKSQPLQEFFNICPTEKYIKQNSIGSCSGFLVASNLLLTAGHCIADQDDCDNMKWVFDYQKNKNTGGFVDREDVYRCRAIVNHNYNPYLKSEPDFSLIELDRTVLNRTPLKYRRQGLIKKRTPLVVIGNPTGLPTKIILGGKVFDNKKGEGYFVADTDTFLGSSGSAVFNEDTGLVEGLLVRGATDYVKSEKELDCYISNRCEAINEEDPDCSGESATKIEEVNIAGYRQDYPERSMLNAYMDKNKEEMDNFYYRGLTVNNLFLEGSPLYFHAFKAKDQSWFYRMISQKGTNLNLKNTKGETLLLVTIRKNDYKAFFDLLLRGAKFSH